MLRRNATGALLASVFLVAACAGGGGGGGGGGSSGGGSNGDRGPSAPSGSPEPARTVIGSYANDGTLRSFAVHILNSEW